MLILILNDIDNAIVRHNTKLTYVSDSIKLYISIATYSNPVILIRAYMCFRLMMWETQCHKATIWDSATSTDINGEIWDGL
jgi:hypothetical protein